MNDDRISELYKGEILDETAQDSARRRIHWLCSNGVGSRVIDVGCSQGIASILLGREGFEVVGVDTDPAVIEYARRDLAAEESGTVSRVGFEKANAVDLPFPDDSFDTILLGNVIHLLTLPERVLAEAARILVPGGRVLITVPFGLHGARHDHRHTFFSDDLMDLIGKHFAVTEAAIAEGYFRVLGCNDGPAAPSERVRRDLSIDAARYTREVQEQLSLSRRENDSLALKAREVAKAVAASEAKVTKLSEEMKRLSTKVVELEAERPQLMDGAREARALSKKLSEAKAALRTAERRTADLERINAEVELARWRLATEVQTERWKLRSMRSRRWWRIGAALGRARRSPGRLLSVPFEVVSIVFDRQPSEPRPAAIPKPTRGGGGNA